MLAEDRFAQHATGNFYQTMLRDAKDLEKCGMLAIVVMLFTGTILGVLGVILAHFLTKYFEGYYLILVFPIVMALFLGFGLSLGARIGRCTRLKLVAAIVVLLFAIVCYGALLFLNDYYDKLTPKPANVLQEYFSLATETQNFLGKLPYLSEYIKPADPKVGDIGTKFVEFIKAFPDLAQKTPVTIGTIFDLALFTPVRGYLVHPGLTTWDAKSGALVFDGNLVKTWMGWTVEFLLVFLIALLMTRGGAKKAYRKSLERERQKSGAPLSLVKTKPPKERKADKQKNKAASVSAAPKLAPPVSAAEQEAAQTEPKPEKKRLAFFWGKKKPKAPPVEEEVPAGAGPEPATKPAEPKLEMEFPEDQENAQYALILHQYNPARERDLIQLIQNVSQVPEDKARKLLKVPALLKRDMSAQDARMAIDKFNQVQAQVKLITMQQLLEIQKKQQQSVQPAPSASSQPSAPQSAPGEPAGERYALILRKFDPAQQQPILELLSSLSGKPVDQLQQTLKPPALILRDATKDEVTMIAKQFEKLQAEVKSLTMTELQKLMTKK